ncbi:transporter substrate-binding domain-containing protein [Marinobacter sp. M216]|uniref:Transporter substrate-binding domain-containing protein n=1 Tax=Marinobacter albus TaxID=3030833 RepID=A0ABT7HDQ2_9GAMM|nr:transporter substrate-binding domain-containing protein [Marinobacter sp. M216]MDK9558481.1 transporter substrate-binding domain-containing protein [Marinobacter sp. M216]
MSRTLALVTGVFAMCWGSAASPKTEITVGAYYFPPVAEISHTNEPQGLLGDLIQGIEAANEDVEIRVFYTSPKRRYLDFEAGLYDVIFFESADWGWSDRDATMSRPILTDEELYVALKKPDRDLSFFEDISRHHIVAMSGYHYGFADFETDSQVLLEKFNIEFSDSHSRNLQLIKADRPSVAEVAIISRSYLQMHLSEHPEDWRTLLISDKLDQRYQLRIIARKDGPVTADDMLHLMAPLVTNGAYRLMVEKWGLQLPRGFLTGFDLP